MFFAWDAAQIVSIISWFPLPSSCLKRWKKWNTFSNILALLQHPRNWEAESQRTPSRLCGGQSCNSELLGFRRQILTRCCLHFTPWNVANGTLFFRILHTCKVLATSWKESWVQDKTSFFQFEFCHLQESYLILQTWTMRVACDLPSKLVCHASCCRLSEPWRMTQPLIKVCVERCAQFLSI